MLLECWTRGRHCIFLFYRINNTGILSDANFVRFKIRFVFIILYYPKFKNNTEHLHQFFNTEHYFNINTSAGNGARTDPTTVALNLQ